LCYTSAVVARSEFKCFDIGIRLSGWVSSKITDSWGFNVINKLNSRKEGVKELFILKELGYFILDFSNYWLYINKYRVKNKIIFLS
jgi:hypothetical protein